MIVISDGVGNSFLKQMKVQGKREIRYPLPIFVWKNISRFFVLNVTKTSWRLDWLNKWNTIQPKIILYYQKLYYGS